jgi:hypothetical protein
MLWLRKRYRSLVRGYEGFEDLMAEAAYETDRIAFQAKLLEAGEGGEAADLLYGGDGVVSERRSRGMSG